MGEKLMARKPRSNPLEGLMADFGSEPPAPPSPPAREIPKQHTRGPVAALENDIRSSAARTVQEISPDLIVDSSHQDRLLIDDDEVKGLRESIATHGQQVPILVRPHSKLSGQFEIVYGRRRLMAIRALGIPAKALVRSLDDKEAILAQGHENNHRKDPSFIEKALFAGELEEANYSPDIIWDALDISRSYASQMRKVLKTIPRDVINLIGAAPGIGRRRWHAAVDLLSELNVSVEDTVPENFADKLDSNGRFEAWYKAIESLKQRPSPTPTSSPQVISSTDGEKIGVITMSRGRAVLRMDAKQVVFSQWLNQHADEVFKKLYADWSSEQADENR
jgi:ParB family chromosome partitioning protein